MGFLSLTMKGWVSEKLNTCFDALRPLLAREGRAVWIGQSSAGSSLFLACSRPYVGFSRLFTLVLLRRKGSFALALPQQGTVRDERSAGSSVDGAVS